MPVDAACGGPRRPGCPRPLPDEALAGAAKALVLTEGLSMYLEYR